ncbi:MAG TPA: hypothetical protein VFV79_07850 [Saprospiraceae bacterium]|nr:hypothetical protein [Saprospiraceae bacterium]
MNRNDVLEKIRLSLERNLAELTQALNDYESASNIDETDTLDPEDLSQQTEFKEMQMRMKFHLEQVNDQLSRLQELANKKVNSVEAGAIVETDRILLFIGVSCPSIPVDGKEILGISTETPIFAALKGKTAGDIFKMGKEEHSIASVY